MWCILSSSALGMVWGIFGWCSLLDDAIFADGPVLQNTSKQRFMQPRLSQSYPVGLRDFMSRFVLTAARDT